jgi:hypothetical protein
MEAMNATDLKKALDIAIESGQAVFISGPPGSGKSDIVKQAAAARKKKLMDIRMLLMDPVDFRGVPHLVKNADGSYTTVWSRPSMLPKEEGWIIFLDEINAASSSLQAVAYQLTLEKRVGEHALHPDTIIIAAGNRETDRAVTNRMPTPLANRFIHLELKPEITPWIEWALEHDVEPEVIAFLRMRPELLFVFEPNKGEKAFPSPRSWGNQVNHILKAYKKQGGKDTGLILHLIEGSIGKGAAIEFVAFLDIWKSLPNPALVLKSPDAASIPTQPSVLYALTSALARIVDASTMENLVAYGKRLSKKEFSTMMVLDAIKRKPELQNTPAFIQWATDNQEALV